MKHAKFLFMTLIALASVFSTAFAAATGNIAPLITTAISGVAFNAIYTPFTGLSFIAFAPLIDSQNYREFYAAVRNLGLRHGIVAAPGHIISEQQITSGTTQYSFATRQTSIDGSTSTFPLQKGVKDNDLFVAYKIGILLDNRAATTSNNPDRQSYASYAVFNAVTNTYADLRAFYSGFLNYKVGVTQFLDQFSTADFEKVPMTQKTSATNENEWSLDWALTDIGARPIFSGKADNDVQLQLISNGGSFNPSASSGVNVVAFFAKGVVLKNGANKDALYGELVAASGLSAK